MKRDDLRKALLGLAAPKPASVEINGVTYFVRVLTAFDAEDMRKKLEKHKADDGCETGRVLACLLCDENGELLFDIASADDVAQLSKLPPKVNEAIFRVSREVNEPGN